MALNSMQEIFEKAASRSIPFWRVVLETDMEERQVTEEQSMEKMRAAWHAMLESVVSYQGDQRSRSGLVGGDGAQMRRYAAADTTYSRPLCAEVIANGPQRRRVQRLHAEDRGGHQPQAPAVYCLRYWCLCTRWAAPPRKRFCRLCIPLPASARWSASGPVSPVLPAAVRLRSARLPLWRLAL